MNDLNCGSPLTENSATTRSTNEASKWQKKFILILQISAAVEEKNGDEQDVEREYCALPTEKLNGSQYFWEECFLNILVILGLMIKC